MILTVFISMLVDSLLRRYDVGATGVSSRAMTGIVIGTVVPAALTIVLVRITSAAFYALSSDEVETSTTAAENHSVPVAIDSSPSTSAI